MGRFFDGDLSPQDERGLLRFLAGSQQISEVLASNGPDWLIEGWLASSATMVDGSPESGKSSLVAGMAAAVATGTPWLGAPVTTDRNGPVVVIATDPSDRGQWAKKGHDLGVPDDAWELIAFSPERWDAYEDLADGLQARLLVFDNVTSGIEGSINEADPTLILGPLGRISSAGTPVVAIAHSGKQGGPGPMGPTAYKAWRRHGIHVRGTGDRRTLKRAGNLGSWPDVVVIGAAHGAAVKYTLASEDQKPNRSTTRLDENAEIAQWIVANCQNNGVNEVGKLVSEEFGGTPGSRRTSLKSGALSKLLKRQGTAASTRWTLAK